MSKLTHTARSFALRESIGVSVIVGLAILSTITLALMPSGRPPGRTMWTSAKLHAELYEPKIRQWNDHESPRVNMTLMGLPALEQRMLSAFLARTSAADVIEAERRIAARAFTGPLDAVGFVDLTDRLRDEGIADQINTPSFSPWTSRGRIFGIPHDIHPVMLAYRADIIEAAGIDVSTIETWDDFVRVLRPLMATKTKSGEPQHYLLNFWETHFEQFEVFILQAGGTLFDASDAPTLNSDINARVMAQLVAWSNGPDRICADAPEFSASGNRLLLEGYVLAALMPDWMCNVWKKEIPQLSGKIKLMPIPAWDAGGRRTSVRGGTMLGLSRTAENPDELWRFAKYLYLSRDLARQLYKEGDIVTPVKTFWDDPIFDEPDPFFCNQAKGRMYLNLASSVPPRASSPYNRLAQLRMQDALVALNTYSRQTRSFDVDSLMPESRRLLDVAQAAVRRELDRNVFLKENALTQVESPASRTEKGLP